MNGNLGGRSKIAVVHAGVRGLYSALTLAFDHEVVLQDDRALHVNMINNGHMPVVDRTIQGAMGQKGQSLRATRSKRDAIEGASIVVIATPAEFSRWNRSIDTASLTHAIQSAVEINPQATVIIESTVPVGFARNVAQQLRCRNLVSAPTAARPRWALQERLSPLALIVGGAPRRARHYSDCMLQGPLRQTQPPLLLTGSAEAEAIHLLHQKRLGGAVPLPPSEVIRWANLHLLDVDQVFEGLALLDCAPSMELDPLQPITSSELAALSA